MLKRDLIYPIMYCTNCGKEIEKGTNFCENCGSPVIINERKIEKIETIHDKESPAHIKEKRSTPKKDLFNLQKLYITTGNLSMIKAIGASIIGIAVGFEAENFIGDLLVVLVLNAPYYYFGKKLKDRGIEDLDYSRKVTLGLLTYITISTIINMLSGFTGWIWVFLIYFYYKAYNETKKAISSGHLSKTHEDEDTILETSTYEETTNNKDVSVKQNKNISEGEGSFLEKIYKNTGNASMLFSFLGILFPFIIGWAQSSYLDINMEDLILGAIFSIPFLIPFYYFGNKIKKEGMKNLKKTSKISLGMLIYVSLFALISMAMGGGGVLWFIVIYYYYKAYKETKKTLAESHDSLAIKPTT